MVTITSRPATPRSVTGLPRLLRSAPVRSLGDHLAAWGPVPPTGALLVEEIRRSGLRGRGGAGFPLAAKLAAAASRRGPAVVVVNAAESEPLSTKDRTLVHANPHLVIDGAVALAGAIGATDVVICAERGQPATAHRLLDAAAERRACGYDGLAVGVAQAPDRYVASQETALVKWLDGGEARPTASPPRPTERGVGRRPTLVSNAETVAHAALVARFGADWYRAIGGDADGDAGSRLVTVVGAVERPGVFEVPLGLVTGDIVAAAGGIASGVSGLLVGGYGGAWLAPGALAAPFSRDGLSPWGGVVGCASLTVLPDGACGLAETARVLWWLAGQSAGQCGPCIHGLPALARAFDAVVAGDPAGAPEVARLAAMVHGRGGCSMPDGAARLASTALVAFAADLPAHRRRGRCPGAPGLLPTPSPGAWR